MGLSAVFVEKHIVFWAARFSGQALYAYRAKWPRHLFHHAPLENAVSILKAGNLLSRNDSHLLRVLDVAAPGVIDSSPRAHGFVRFYFRPRTPTQYHIEGIRKKEECRYGNSSHAPILVMFVLDARYVLTRDGTCFSAENMQKGGVEQSSEEDFSQIPFQKVYHEGQFCGDQSITSHRCAEVLAKSPLPLERSLQWVFCRSEAERITLLHALGENAWQWINKIMVSDDLKVFDKNYTFVESVSLSSQGVAFKLNPRRDGRPVKYEMKVFDKNNSCILHSQTDELPSRPPSGGDWLVKGSIKPGTYQVEIYLEGQKAFNAPLSLNFDLF